MNRSQLLFLLEYCTLVWFNKFNIYFKTSFLSSYWRTRQQFCCLSQQKYYQVSSRIVFFELSQNSCNVRHYIFYWNWFVCNISSSDYVVFCTQMEEYKQEKLHRPYLSMDRTHGMTYDIPAISNGGVHEPCHRRLHVGKLHSIEDALHEPHVTELQVPKGNIPKSAVRVQHVLYGNVDVCVEEAGTGYVLSEGTVMGVVELLDHGRRENGNAGEEKPQYDVQCW